MAKDRTFTKKNAQWFHAFFADRDIAIHHRRCQIGRGRVTRFFKNGAGYEVRWREKTEGERRALARKSRKEEK